MKLPHQVSGAMRTFSYFLASGTHDMLEGVPYLDLYGKEPSAIEQAYAIFANVIELDEKGDVTNLKHAEKRATDYLRSYCDPAFCVEPPFEAWEVSLMEEPNTISSHEPLLPGSTRAYRFIGHWSRSQRPVPAAVGELNR